MKIFFKIDSLSAGLGPNFILTDDFGLTSPFEFTREELLNGVEITVTPGSKFIYVQSTGTYCNDCCVPPIIKQYTLPTTTTTTTISPSTTTTSTSTSTSTTSTTTAQITTTATAPITSLCFTVNHNLQQYGVNIQSCTLPIGGNGPVFNSRPVYVLNEISGDVAVYWNGSNWVFTKQWLTTKSVSQTLTGSPLLPISSQGNWTPECQPLNDVIRICSIIAGDCIIS